jgi:hypothetical protein
MFLIFALVMRVTSQKAPNCGPCSAKASRQPTLRAKTFKGDLFAPDSELRSDGQVSLLLRRKADLR